MSKKFHFLLLLSIGLALATSLSAFAASCKDVGTGQICDIKSSCMNYWEANDWGYCGQRDVAMIPTTCSTKTKALTCPSGSTTTASSPKTSTTTSHQTTTTTTTSPQTSTTESWQTLPKENISQSAIDTNTDTNTSTTTKIDPRGDSDAIDKGIRSQPDTLAEQAAAELAAAEAEAAQLQIAMQELKTNNEQTSSFYANAEQSNLTGVGSGLLNSGNISGNYSSRESSLGNGGQIGNATLSKLSGLKQKGINGEGSDSEWSDSADDSLTNENNSKRMRKRGLASTSDLSDLSASEAEGYELSEASYKNSDDPYLSYRGDEQKAELAEQLRNNKALRDRLRERLKNFRAKLQKGDKEGVPEQAVLDLVAAAIEESEKPATNALKALQPLSPAEAFKMNADETRSHILAMLSEFDENGNPPELLVEDPLFRRVHLAHQRVAERGDLRLKKSAVKKSN